MEQPGRLLGVGEAERYRGEEAEGRMLALPVVLGGGVRLGVAGGDRVEHVEGADTLAGGEVLGRDAAVGHVGDALREPLRADPETGEVAPPARDDDHLLAALRDGRCADRRCRGYRAGTGRTLGQEFASLHESSHSSRSDDAAPCKPRISARSRPARSGTYQTALATLPRRARRIAPDHPAHRRGRRHRGEAPRACQSITAPATRAGDSFTSSESIERLADLPVIAGREPHGADRGEGGGIGLPRRVQLQGSRSQRSSTSLEVEPPASRSGRSSQPQSMSSGTGGQHLAALSHACVRRRDRTAVR
jgi:hypothetical protein